jgi:hypothetical protein
LQRLRESVLDQWRTRLSPLLLTREDKPLVYAKAAVPRFARYAAADRYLLLRDARELVDLFDVIGRHNRSQSYASRVGYALAGTTTRPTASGFHITAQPRSICSRHSQTRPVHAYAPVSPPSPSRRQRRRLIQPELAHQTSELEPRVTLDCEQGVLLQAVPPRVDHQPILLHALTRFLTPIPRPTSLLEQPHVMPPIGKPVDSRSQSRGGTMSWVALLRARRERRADRRRERRNADADRIQQGPPVQPGNGSTGYKKFFRGGGW